MKFGLREEIASEAQGRCGYCRTPQWIVNVPLEIDHLQPRARSGETVRENLWLACRLCNSYKADRVSGVDPETGRKVRLFHPRRQRWSTHFRWEGVLIVGLTPTGRATVATLRLNDRLQVEPREIWMIAGLFPFPE